MDTKDKNHGGDAADAKMIPVCGDPDCNSCDLIPATPTPAQQHGALADGQAKGAEPAGKVKCEDCGGTGLADNGDCEMCGDGWIYPATAPAPQAAAGIKTWQERADDGTETALTANQCLKLAEAEIADLRAALAAQSTPSDDLSLDEGLVKKVTDSFAANFPVPSGYSANEIIEEVVRLIEGKAAQAAPAVAVMPYGYAAEAPDGHVTFFKDNPKGMRKLQAEGLGIVRDLFTAEAARAPNGWRIERHDYAEDVESYAHTTYHLIAPNGSVGIFYGAGQDQAHSVAYKFIEALAAQPAAVAPVDMQKMWAEAAQDPEFRADIERQSQEVRAIAAPAPSSADRVEGELPELPWPAMPHGSIDYFSKGQMQDYARDARKPLVERLGQYDAVLRNLALSLSAGGWNSDGLIDPKVADEKIRWGIENLVQSTRRAAQPDQPCFAEEAESNDEPKLPFYDPKRALAENWFVTAREAKKYGDARAAQAVAHMLRKMSGAESVEDIDLDKLRGYLADTMVTLPATELHAIADALAASRRAASGGRDGYVLVPKEPTEAMRSACKVLNYADDIDAEWARMLAAAPVVIGAEPGEQK
jgi:hypothetical protein